MTRWARSFAPTVGESPRLLVLGSAPGQRSLADAEYYAHPQNQFWPIIEALFGVPRVLPYAERLDALAARGVALWDVLAACERPGSLDQAIVRSSEVANPIAAWLQAHPTVTTVATNGGAAARLYQRHVAAEARARVAHLKLPSTSPAYAAMRPAEKLLQWSTILGTIG